MNKYFTFNKPKYILFYYIIGIILFLSACAAKEIKTEQQAILSSQESKKLWEQFQTSQNKNPHQPVSIEYSLRYKTPNKEGHRVIAILWNNGNYPYRLDLLASIGSLLAKVKEDKNVFIAYTPKENKAYFYQGENLALFALSDLGIVLPISIADISNLSQGYYTSIFSSNYGSAQVTGNDEITYTLEQGSLPGSLSLNSKGLPKMWQDKNNVWKIEFIFERLDEKEKNINLNSNNNFKTNLKKLQIEHKKGYSAILLIKDIALQNQPFEPEQMNFNVPDKTNFIYIDKEADLFQND